MTRTQHDCEARPDAKLTDTPGRELTMIMSSGSRPAASSPEALLRMVRQPRRDTGPEMAIRRLLHARGLRYRVDVPLPGMRRRADLVFSSARVAVFVDGCFWCRLPA